MIENFAQISQPFLDFPIVRRIRRNHALEHATIHMLSRQARHLRIAGRADHSGFYLYGEVESNLVKKAAQEALDRMNAGESQWAVHPNCGTGLVTTGFLTGVAALLGLTGAHTLKERWNRLPLIMLFTMIAAILSQPLGLDIQKYITTCGEPGDLTISSVTRRESLLPFEGKLIIHRVGTHKG